MPVKLRRAKRRRQYPPAIDQLIAGEPIAESEEARNHLIAVYYLHRHDELGEKVIERAGHILAQWRTRRGE